MKKMICLSTWFIGFFFFILSAWAYQPFPDTGQIMCYDENHQEVPCNSIQPGDPYYGQDGHYQPHLPRSYTKLGHGGAVLEDNALHVDEGGLWIMTRDNVTGLIWEVKTNANRNDRYNWSNAHNIFIAELNSGGFGGFSDWRLPEIKELSLLVNSGVINPAIDNAWFPKTVSSNYWSSTTNARNTYYAWLIYFDHGYVSNLNKSNSYYVRAVRSGQSDIREFGDLQVSIEPQGAIDAGAQWRRTRTTTWQNHEYTETNVPTGTHTIEFKDISGWLKPENQEVTVEEGHTTTATGTYEPIPDIEAVFYELYYLSNNPDVAMAVKKGILGSGWQHFVNFGNREGRSYQKPDDYGNFNELYYLLNNPDVAIVVNRGIIGTGWEHYKAFGQSEGRSYSLPEGYGSFNETYYLANNPDVAMAVNRGVIGTGWQHYKVFGQSEGRSYILPEGYGNFNETYYLVNYPDVAMAVNSGVFGKGWEHYKVFGQAEGRSHFKPEAFNGVEFGGWLPFSATMLSSITEEKLGLRIAGDKGSLFWDYEGGQGINIFHDSDIKLLSTGDTDGDGFDDLFGVWDSGLWTWQSLAQQWTKLSSDPPISIALGDMTANGMDDLIASWSEHGVYYRDSSSGLWYEVANSAADLLASGDVTGDGLDDLVGVWPEGGIWFLDTNNQWVNITESSPSALAVTDMTASGIKDIIGNWSGGVYYLDSISQEWLNLNKNPALFLTSEDLAGNGQKDLVGVWPDGVWAYNVEEMRWEKLTSAQPDVFVTGHLLSQPIGSLIDPMFSGESFEDLSAYAPAIE